MDPTILYPFLWIELGLVIGYFKREIEEWYRWGIVMVWGFVQALGRSR
jgi:hypothetical protein